MLQPYCIHYFGLSAADVEMQYRKTNYRNKSQHCEAGYYYNPKVLIDKSIILNTVAFYFNDLSVKLNDYVRHN
jgi:hypothetical protein